MPNWLSASWFTNITPGFTDGVHSKSATVSFKKKNLQLKKCSFVRHSVDTDSCTFCSSAELGSEDEMLKPEIFSNPALMLEYKASKNRYISDGTPAKETKYGLWKIERSGAVACVFVGETLCLKICRLSEPLNFQLANCTPISFKMTYF